ncbi:WD40 repeat-like protein [Hymenopellis radicata]|nr:WD40 repeat-like protein [Hymenopellis radicata]
MLRHRLTKRFPSLGSRKDRERENATASVSDIGSGSHGIRLVPSSRYTTISRRLLVSAIHVGLNGLHEALKVVNEAADVFGPLKSVIGGLLACIERTLANHEEMARLIKTIDHLASLVTVRLERLGATNASRKRMLKLESDLKNIVKNIEDLQARGFVVRLAENSVDAEKLVGAYQQIKDVLNAFQLEVGLEIERNVQDLLNEVVIRDLRRSRDASFRAAIKTDTLSRGPCTAGTRVEILDKIMAWARADDADSPPVFWLTGLAGTGKTTIAYTICERMWTENKLLVSFFCSRQLDSKDSRLIVPTICRNLAELFRSYATKLVPVLKGDSVLGEARIHEQIDKLLAGPWSASRPGRDGLPVPVVVIDALDESDDGVEFLKSLLRVVGDKSLRGIKFLVTSRAQPEIVDLCHSFQLPADMICCLHEVPLVDVQDDIAQFLADKLPELRDTDEFTQLSRRTDEQQAKLRKLLKPGATSGSTLLLDQLYEQVLSTAFDEEDEDFLHTRLDILHAVVCTQELISIPVIAQLLGLNEDTTKTCVDSLHSVLYVTPLDHLVSCYHASFPEFILDAQRSRFTAPLSFTKAKSRELEVFCDKPVFDARLTDCCFRIMTSELQFNICNLPSSSTLDCHVDNLRELVQTNISPVLRYAARHWGEHLLAAGRTDRSSLHDKLKAFLTDVFLFWLEAMNLIGSKSLCFPLLRLAVGGWNLKIWDSTTGELLQELVGHTKWITSVSFSDDGTYIISASADMSIRIWDASTGKQLRKLLGHTKGVLAIAFSHDTQYIVSGSEDLSVRIWARDPKVGNQLKQLDGHIDGVRSVAFSHDDMQVVSGSYDMSVRIWDVKTGQQVRELLSHTKEVWSVAFSPCGPQIVSGSADNSIRIWDASTGKELKQFSTTSTVISVVFSPDGQNIVSAVGCSIQIWDVMKGELLNEFTSSSHVCSVMFSHDGTRVVSASNTSIRVWDTMTSEQSKKLKGHTGPVQCLAFSSDGKQVISASLDKTIQVWDAVTGRQLKEFNYTLEDSILALSSDGALACSVAAKYGSPLKVWDTAAGKLLTEQYIGGEVTCLSFSPDSTHVIAGLHTGSLIISDSRMGEQLRDLRDLRGHTESITSVAFFPNSFELVSGSRDGSIRTWDTRNGENIQVLAGHTRSVTSVAVSGGGEQIVSGSKDKSVVVWDAKTGECLYSLALLCIGSPVSITFSPRVEHPQIAAGLGDDVAVWDMTTREKKLLRPRGHSNVRSVAFSPDGTLIVSGSGDGSVRVRRNIEDPESWHVDKEGWIWSAEDYESDSRWYGARVYYSHRLMWLSPERHLSLLTPGVAMIMSQKGYSTVSFDDCHIGTDWHKCYHDGS